jgi:hypothetical protein
MPLGRSWRYAALLPLALLLSNCAFISFDGDESLTPAEKMMWSTYAVATRRGVASCLVVNRKDPGSNRVIPVLVTASHVLAVAPHGPYYLAMRTADENGDPDIAVLEIMADETGPVAYTTNPHADVAALELRMPKEMAATVGLPSFIDEDKVGRLNASLHPGEMVSILGFPSVLPATQGGFPILRRGAVASYRPGNLGRSARFLIDTTVYPGDSGGPVFTTDRRDRAPILVGLVTEHIGRKVGAVPLAVAIDARAVRETLELLPHSPGERPEIPVPNGRVDSQGVTAGMKVKGRPEMFFKVLHADALTGRRLPLASSDSLPGTKSRAR